jgi:hypothetical protein
MGTCSLLVDGRVRSPHPAPRGFGRRPGDRLALPATRSLIALGALARLPGDLAKAERLLLEGLERAEREGDAEAIALALEGLAAARHA